MTDDQPDSEIPAEEPAAHVEAGNRLMLQKSYAMKYLMDRGYKVTFDDLKPSDE